nr:heterogeneous nuclear ribonucleoprotein 1 [Tanacetum cinerariifolium]
MNQSHTNDRASPGKIFIGGLPKETEYNEFNNHFGKYGDIRSSVIIKDRMSGQPKGFGFITYADPLVVDKVIHDTHVFSGK